MKSTYTDYILYNPETKLSIASWQYYGRGPNGEVSQLETTKKLHEAYRWGKAHGAMKAKFLQEEDFVGEDKKSFDAKGFLLTAITVSIQLKTV